MWVAELNIENKVDVVIDTEKSEELDVEKQMLKKTTLKTNIITTKYTHAESKEITVKVSKTEKIGTNTHDCPENIPEQMNQGVKTSMMELDLTMVKERKYQENEEFGKFHKNRDTHEGHILISKTERLEELEKLAMKEIMAMYENYSTMASEENLSKCRDAVEEIIAKYENYFTMISKERPVKH